MVPALRPDHHLAAQQAARFPRLRYMGSKYRLLPQLAEVFAELQGRTALDAFCGSGVVSYLLKCLGYQVTSNDMLRFPAVVAQAAIANDAVRLTQADIDLICGPPADARDFIQSTFAGLYFTEDDRRFLDSAWSHIDRMAGYRRALALAGLILAAARKQPRGVFTVTNLRYDDGRRDLHLPLRDQFAKRVADYNAAVFDNGHRHAAKCSDVWDLDATGYDLVYLDPPYAPPRDDSDYIKRYHFLEGLAGYWHGQQIMHATRTKKLAKRHTPFAHKATVVEALRRTLHQFAASTIVLSTSSNAIPDVGTLEALLRSYKRSVEVRPIEHTYSFGTHSAARRRTVSEYLLIGQ
jgi:DNA adenine methylase/adenine-specific DNA-methyltransferase